MANIFDVAKEVLHVAGGEISLVRLQLLCYYSWLWRMIRHSEDLMSERFIKVECGAECKELSEALKGFKMVSENDIDISLLSSGGLSDSEKDTIERVVEINNGYPTLDLINNISRYDSPSCRTFSGSIIGENLTFRDFKHMVKPLIQSSVKSQEQIDQKAA